MFDQNKFGEKLKNHRQLLNLTQEEVGEKIGVSGQAVSKWEKGECLPDCYNLKMISDIYNISLDILLETENTYEITTTANKIKQLATEYIWNEYSKAERSKYHIDLGDNLWEMWKAIYYVEIGDREIQEREMKHGKNRIGSSYGLKAWDDNGFACIVKTSMINNLDKVTDVELSLIQTLASNDYYNLLKHLSCEPVSKELLIDKTSFDVTKFNEMIIYLLENKIVEYFTKNEINGYKLTVNRGIIAYILLSALYLLTSTNHSTSEYLPS